MDTEYSVYLGQEQKNGFTGFLAEKNFFCVVEIFDGYTNEQGEQLMSALAGIGSTDFESLAGFDSSVSEIFKRLNIPLDTSIAIGYKKNLTLYLKTIGSGEIYIGRRKSFEQIIHGTINAAGKYEKDDFYVFTTSFFTQSLKGITHTKSLLHKHTSIRDFPEHIKQTIGTEDDTGAVALFVKMTQNQETYISSKPQFNGGAKIKEYVQRYVQIISKLDNRKKIIIGLALLVCVGLFGWNMTKGIQNRGGMQLGQGQSYEEQKQHVESTIGQAATKTEATTEGLQLLQEAQGIVLAMKKTAPKDKQADIMSLQKKVTDTESLLVKRVYKEPQEYYDFAVEEKSAHGTKLSLFEDKAYVLNPDGKVYILTLEKKALVKVTLPKKVSGDSLVAGYEQNTYVLTPEEGIIRMDETGKGKTVIPKETQWSSINSMQVYNGNIYLLDGGNNALYKYPVTTDAYGDRVSYFKGSYMDMDTSSSFAIDVSVYVAKKDVVTKYTAGLKDDFTLSIPGKDISITKAITHTDQTELYLWDKKNSVLYIASRDGVYERQVASPSFSQASDIEVYNNRAFLLKDAKLYSIDL
ncbi:MAG: hypothetical protein V1922_05360 [bacterium]